MENQHREIKGYRDLNQDEIDLINEIKMLGVKTESLLEKVEAHIRSQRKACHIVEQFEEIIDKDEHRRLELATPERFVALAKTEFQTGLMYLTRAVGQQTTF